MTADKQHGARVAVALIGPGLIGATLLEQIAAQGPALRAQQGIDIDVAAIASSKKLHLRQPGAPLDGWRDAFAAEVYCWRGGWSWPDVHLICTHSFIPCPSVKQPACIPDFLFAHYACTLYSIPCVDQSHQPLIPINPIIPIIPFADCPPRPRQAPCLPQVPPTQCSTCGCGLHIQRCTIRPIHRVACCWRACGDT